MCQYSISNLCLVIGFLIMSHGSYSWAVPLKEGLLGFPSGSVVKASASNAGDPGSISGSGRSPGEGNGNPLPLDRRAWQATVHEVTESQTLLSD